LAIVEGETLQMLSSADDGMTEESYLEIVRLKTGELFAACAWLGGLVAKGLDHQIAALRSYGLNLGIAFQIRDDTLDLVGDTEQLGKPVARDLEQGKMSLAALYARSRFAGAREVLLSGNTGQVVEMLRTTGALEYAVQKAGDFSSRAKKALAVLPRSEARAALHDLADFAVARQQ
jgi:octaprenyl-diphosphate synthase